MYLVEVSKSGKLVIEDDGVYAINEFREVLETKGLGEPALRCVALVHDYYSPFRHRDSEERATWVTREVYGRETKKTINFDNPKIVAAVEKYKFLQYDQDRDELQNTISLIRKTVVLKNSLEVTVENLTQINSIMKRVGEYEKRRDYLKKKIEEEGSKGPVETKTSLYRLEKALQEKRELN